MNLKKLFFMLTFVVLLGTTAFAQPYATVYVDVTNGGIGLPYNGTTPALAFARIGDGLSALAANGTLVIYGGSYNGVLNNGAAVDINTGTYPLLVANSSLTIELRPLPSPFTTNVNLTAGAITFNVVGGTLNIVSTNGAYLSQASNAVTLTAGNINLDAATSWRFTNAGTTTINFVGGAAFTNAAPQKNVDVSLSYTGTGTFNAGQESNYGSYGAGTITVNKASGTVTFPNAITAVAGITVQTGASAVFSGAVTMGLFDVTNSSTGTVTFSSTVGFNYADAVGAHTDLGQVSNTAGGSVVFNSAVTWSASADITGARDFETATFPTISNGAAGSILFNSTITFSPDPTTGFFLITMRAINNSGTLTLGTMTANTSSATTWVALNVINSTAGGTLNLSGGTLRGTLTNGNATAKTNVNGALTLRAVLTNSGTGTGGVTLNADVTMPVALVNVTTGGTISGTGKIICSNTAGTTSFNGGTLGNIDVTGLAGTVDFITGAFIASTLNISNGTALFTQSGTITNLNLSGPDATSLATVATTRILTVNNFTQSGGTFTLTAGTTTTLDVKVDFNRSGGIFTAPAVSLVSFTGSGAQSVNPGSLFQTNQLQFNNIGGIITVGNSLRATGNVTIFTLTNVSLGTLNVILNGANNKMLNNGTYTSTGNGGIIMGGVTTVVGGLAGAGYTVDGTGAFSNLTVDVGDVLAVAIGPTIASTVLAAGVNTVTMSADITALLAVGDYITISGRPALNGTYVIQSVGVPGVTAFRIISAAATDAGAGGGVQVYNAAKVTAPVTGVRWNGILTLKTGALVVTTAVDFGPTGSTASIVRYPETTPGIFAISTSTFNAGNISYDLTYTGAITAARVVGGELTSTPANVRTWTVQTTGAFTNDLPAGADVTFGGTLYVEDGATVNLPTGGATQFVLSGNSKTHTIRGTISFAQAGDVLSVTGTGVTLNGSTTVAHAATIGSFTTSSTNLTIANVQSFAGTFATTGSAVVNLGMGGSTLAIADQRILGAVTFGGSSVTLTSNIDARAGVGLAAGSLNFGNFNLNITTAGNFTQTAGSSFTAGTGYLVMNLAAANFTLTSALPNLRILASTTNAAATGSVSSILELGSTTTTSPLLTLGGNNLTVSGATINMISGGALANPITSLGATNPVQINIAAGHPLLASGDGQYVQIAGNATIPAGNYPYTRTSATQITVPFDNTGAGVSILGTITPLVTILSDNNAATNGGDLISTGTILTLNGADAVVEEWTENSTVGLTLASLPVATARTFVVLDGLTQTAGDINLGIHSIRLQGENTAPLAYAQTAGNIYATTGWLDFAFTNAASFTHQAVQIDRLKISAAATNQTITTQVTINKNLWLFNGAYDNGTGATSLALALADGVLINRVANNSTLTRVPSFGTNVDVTYSGAAGGGGSLTGNELPGNTTNLRNLTLAVGAGNLIVLNANSTVNNLFKLTSGNFSNGTVALTVAPGKTIEMNGGAFTNAPTVTNYNLTYTATAAPTTVNEFQNATGISVDALTVNGAAITVTLHAARTVKDFNLTAGTFANGGFALTVTGNMNAAAGTYGGLGALIMNGTAAQTITVPAAGLTLAGGLTLNNALGVTLAGGNLTMGAAQVVTFTSGNFTTGANILVLSQTAAGQGFTRTSGHVVGNVRHAIFAGAGTPTNANPNGRFEFPVGTATKYRPFAITFSATYPAVNPTSVTVNMVDLSPDGVLNMPLDAVGVPKVGNYAPYYWLVSTSPSPFTSTQLFDVDMTGTNIGVPYTDDQKLRIIRRQDGSSLSNGWSLQGVNYQNYQTVVGTDTTAVVRTTASIGGIINEGTRFAIGVPARNPNVTGPATFSVAEGATSGNTVTFTAAALNLNETITAASYSLVGAPAFAALSSTTAGLITFTPNFTANALSPYTFTVRVTTSAGMITNVPFTLTVTNTNQAPSFTATGALKLANTTMLNTGSITNSIYQAIDPDAGDVLTYTLSPITPAFAGTATITAGFGTGLLSFTPAFADGGKVFTVTVNATDTGLLVASTTALITVNYAQLKGDADGDGVVLALDAAKILQFVVGLYTPPSLPVWNYVSDVNLSGVGDGTVGAIDAAAILYRVNQTPNAWPTTFKSMPVAGDVDFGRMNRDNGNFTLPINLTNTSGVRSAYIELELGTSVEFNGVTSTLPEGWITASNYANGKLRIAMSGVNPLADGSVAFVNLKLKDKEVVASIQGSASLNDQVNSQLMVKVKEIPTAFGLSQNYPNPFNPTTNIKYTLAEDAKVTLTVYNMLGQRVKTLVDLEQESGYYTVRWDGTNEIGSRVSSGIYIYRLSAGNFVSTIKMNLLK